MLSEQWTSNTGHPIEATSIDVVTTLLNRSVNDVLLLGCVGKKFQVSLSVKTIRGKQGRPMDDRYLFLELLSGLIK